MRHLDPGANMALQFLTCVGNQVRVESGPAAGAVGHVIGQHAYVLVDFAGTDMGGITTGDQVTVIATGQGLTLTQHPAVTVKNCSPALLVGLPGGTRAVDGLARGARGGHGPGRGGRHAWPLLGWCRSTPTPTSWARTRGSARSCPWAWKGCASATSSRWSPPTTGTAGDTGLGYLTIGVISTGQCMLFGHGPGPSTLLSGAADAFHSGHGHQRANLASWLHGGQEWSR